MSNWYGPFTPGEGIKRMFSLFNLALAVLILLAGASELRFDWAEQLVGNYLMVMNPSRPETGGIWEAGRQTLNAHQILNRIIDEKLNSLRHVQEADSFASLAERLGPGEWVNLDRQQFKSLFNALSPGVRDRLIDPARLVWLLTTDAVDRIFCEGQMGALVIYFIDTDNRVIHQLSLNKEDFAGNAGARSNTRLDDMAGVFSRILSADRFFNALFQLPQEMVPELLGNTGTLLSQNGTLTRVGIGDTVDNGYIRLGFEFVSLGEVHVAQVQAREWAVWQLTLVLKGEDL